MDIPAISLAIAKAINDEFIIKTCDSMGQDSATLEELVKVIEPVLEATNDYQI